MCGWVGVFGTTEHEADLRRAAATLATRGPDGSGERVVSTGPLPAGLAHRRLAILDPTPAGAQPMHDPERGVSVVYNGEIYNSPQLRRELEARGARFRSGTDTEVLLLGWAEWGDEVLHRIEGIFSFALLDERRGRALLARDRLGVKPLYWAEVDGRVVAGSAPRAILSLRPELRYGLDHVALAQFLTLLWVPHPRTPWAGIRKLAPGSALTLEDGHVRQWRHWSHPPAGEHALDPTVLREALSTATARQLLSDVPVGLLLSGGLDSTILLELMAVAGGDVDLHALTAGYDPASQRLEINPDDTEYARLAASRHPRVHLTEVEIGGDAADDLDELSLHFDDPVADPAAISLYRLARASATKVLLSGVGGEELFAGYPRHLALGLARRAARLPIPVRRLVAAGSPALHGGQPGPLHGARRNAQKLSRAVGDERPPHYWRMMAQLTHAEVEALMPGCADAALDELDGHSSPLTSTSLSEALAFDRAQFLPNLNLAYVDKAAMAAGVEVRVPLLDEAVVAAAGSADPATFIEDGVTKVPLRRAAAGLVPHDIVHRPKSGFGGPARGWFQGERSAGLRQRVEAVADAGLVCRDAALRLFGDAASGRQDSALAAWALVCLQAWHAEHTVAPVTAVRGGR
ncbi:MAG: asparagine synthase (glutamine-hydrolyzing) [Actinomycetota bacterium]|nr:asparagine synthase (glutamine-hydrolyzing) [Actinomycetota bacterium]